MSPTIVEAVRPTLWRTITTNNTFRLAPWADILYAADHKWWHHRDNKDSWAFAGLKVTIEDPTRQGFLVPDILVLRNDGMHGFTDDRSALRHGANSGYQCVHVAAHLGASRIVLLGLDMRSVNNKQHWHERHPYPLRDHSDGIYSGWIDAFKKLKPELDKRGIEVINCTPGSALTCFPMMDLEEAIDRFGCAGIKSAA